MEDAQEMTKNTVSSFSVAMNNFKLYNKIIEKVKLDAENGVVGYDEKGGKIFDMDLMQGKVRETLE